ncbi:hypothetical protein SUDANB145_04371 [Streptomyces sp. enrichment culture]|uniref:hypothetical protein n=1 Tax=Streptomyces sp. enrichment culture TaxID=1795815 RepID=UPI003F557FA8
MVTVGVFFGILMVAVAGLAWQISRRGSGPTRNPEGLRIEQTHRRAADQARRSYSALSQHDTLPLGDRFRDRR